MILTCSKCTTQFSINPGALGARGRKVKCSRCGHSWFQAPETPPPGEVAPPPPPPASPAVSALDREPVVAAAPASFAAAPAPVVRKEAGIVLKLATCFLAFLMVLSGALLVLPKIGGGALQEAVGLADNSMFTLHNVAVKITPSSNPGKMAIGFTGALKSNAAKTMPAPRVTVILFDRGGREVRTLQYKFPVANIEAGKELAFEPKINNIPDSLSRVVLDLGNNVEQALR